MSDISQDLAFRNFKNHKTQIIIISVLLVYIFKQSYLSVNKYHKKAVEKLKILTCAMKDAQNCISKSLEFLNDLEIPFLSFCYFN